MNTGSTPYGAVGTVVQRTRLTAHVPELFHGSTPIATGATAAADDDVLRPENRSEDETTGMGSVAARNGHVEAVQSKRCIAGDVLAASQVQVRARSRSAQHELVVTLRIRAHAFFASPLIRRRDAGDGRADVQAVTQRGGRRDVERAESARVAPLNEPRGVQFRGPVGASG